MLAAVAVTNLPVAEAAIGKLLATFPDSPLGERGLLRFGTELNRLDRPAQAREKLQLLLGKFIGSTNAPQVQLAIAGTYRREFDWTNTVRALEEWVRRYPGHAALPEVEFQRAWFTEQAGGTNALALFTNYVARFPAHSNAPLAQLRIADFHFSQGAFDTAEASSARPTHCMPPCTIGCLMPNISVKRVLIISVSPTNGSSCHEH